MHALCLTLTQPCKLGYAIWKTQDKVLWALGRKSSIEEAPHWVSRWYAWMATSWERKGMPGAIIRDSYACRLMCPRGGRFRSYIQAYSWQRQYRTRGGDSATCPKPISQRHFRCLQQRMAAWNRTYRSKLAIMSALIFKFTNKSLIFMSVS